MPLKIFDEVEPLSPRSFFRIEEGVRAVGSDSAVVLENEMRRYCEGNTSGRSILVAGHRGSGKTTAVELAFQRLDNEYEKAGRPIRPLLVMLLGPSLLGEETAASQSAATQAAGAENPAAAAGDGKPGELPTGGAKPGGGAAADAGKAAAGAPQAKASGANGAGTGEVGRARIVSNALIQVTLGLHSAAAQAFARAYRERAPQLARYGRRFYGDLPELAAQLEVELWEGIRPARLRDFWARGDFLDIGVLFPFPQQPDNGMRELLALASVCEAYRRISGELKAKEKQSDTAKSETSASLASGESGMQLLKGLAALLTGGLIGGGFLVSHAGAVPALLAGLASALGAAAVFRYSASRSRSRGMDREVEFVMDLSAKTLDRVLPIIVDRLRRAGLPPIFVVDELDKVENLSRHIETLVTHLKKFVAENAFFCFLTDRGYFEAMQVRRRTEPYSKEYTYFSEYLFVTLRPGDLHRYVREMLTSDGDTEAAEDVELLEYIALHRAEMHIVDLRRVLTRWRGEGGVLTLPRGAVRTRTAYKLDLRAQLAVEMVLDGTELDALLERDPVLRQLVYDALYHPARRWKTADDELLDLGEAAEKGAFRSYLEGRIERDEPDSDDTAASAGSKPPTAAARGRTQERANQPVELVSKELSGLLLKHVRLVATLLADDDSFRTELASWQKRRAQDGRPPVGPAVLTALGLDPDGKMLALLEPADREGCYRWRYDTAGIPVAPSAAEIIVEVVQEWRVATEFVREFQQALREVVA